MNGIKYMIAKKLKAVNNKINTNGNQNSKVLKYLLLVRNKRLTTQICDINNKIHIDRTE